ncbi:hypothetical protein A2U01_0089065, partial [Trifolium medium]|nr:hypothetical protein [Trifolium medium]
ESQPSPARNLYTGAAGGCEVEPDAASAVVLAVVLAVVVVVVLLLPVLPVDLSLPSESMSDRRASQHWISHQCPPQ